MEDVTSRRVTSRYRRRWLHVSIRARTTAEAVRGGCSGARAPIRRPPCRASRGCLARLAQIRRGLRALRHLARVQARARAASDDRRDVARQDDRARPHPDRRALVVGQQPLWQSRPWLRRAHVLEHADPVARHRRRRRVRRLHDRRPAPGTAPCRCGASTGRISRWRAGAGRATRRRRRCPGCLRREPAAAPLRGRFSMATCLAGLIRSSGPPRSRARCAATWAAALGREVRADASCSRLPSRAVSRGRSARTSSRRTRRCGRSRCRRFRRRSSGRRG